MPVMLRSQLSLEWLWDIFLNLLHFVFGTVIYFCYFLARLQFHVHTIHFALPLSVMACRCLGRKEGCHRTQDAILKKPGVLQYRNHQVVSPCERKGCLRSYHRSKE